MTEPIIAQRFPYVVQETPGDKMWCACGRSQKQPYCDGSHKGTGLTPIKTTIDRPRTVAWCGCKNSDGKPFCDGTHASLP